MAKKIYIDFDLLIEQVAEGYTVRVLDSPGGQAKARFTLPFEDHELKNFFVQIGHPRSIEHHETHFRDQSEIETVKEFGSRLFKAIFKDEVWDCLSKSLHEMNRQEEIGLRIRLRLLDAPQLADVPWEYLYIPAHKRFLALSVDTPIVRYLRLSEGVKPLSVNLPLNVLVMISNAKDYPSLDVNSEWDKLKAALGDLEQKGLLKLELLESATLSALHHQLRNDEYHVFHFIGHGGFDNQTQEGVLILEDDEGNGRKVSGQKLGTILHDEHTLRLVVLNACEGARTSRNDPFAGTAQSLVQQGIPAVIAMQFEITDKAAITLSHTFYESVAEGYPVDYSLAEARKAINSEQDFDSVEWGTPVLYMRSSDGHIFDIDQIPVLKNEAKEAVENNVSREKCEAFLLAWYSRMALIQEDTLQQREYFSRVDGLLNNLSIELENPTFFYLSDVHADSGERAQVFTVEVLGMLKGIHGEDIAIYFAIAANLSLLASEEESMRNRGEDVPPEIYEETEILISRIELPPDLAIVPSENLYSWCRHIAEYYEEQR